MVFKLGEVSHINVPKLDELSVSNILKMTKDDEELKMYFPDEYYKKLTPERVFFFNIINTVYPQFLSSLISNANSQRMRVDDQYQQEQTIEATDTWVNNLSAIPFCSKVSAFVHCLISVM